MTLSESDTRAKLITPALHKADWPEEWLEREVTPGPVVIDGSSARRGAERADYVLYVNHQGARIKVAIVEAKADSKQAASGLEQAKRYARFHHVPFAFSTNGRRFFEFDASTGETRGPLPIEKFPSWDTLRDRWLAARKIDFADPRAKPLLTSPRSGERYYQRAAVQAALEAYARGEKRVLLPLATGTGKTRVAASILLALHDARQLQRGLFICDRAELRRQAADELYKVFGVEVQRASAHDPALNARVVVATYQTLGVDRDGDGSYLEEHYPPNYFSHIIIDECHRSAWDKWGTVLTRNDQAMQIGLTATPRTFGGANPNGNPEAEKQDEEITANNYRYFGEPVYEYPIAQGIEDGYLANFTIQQVDVVTAGTVDSEYGVDRAALRDARVAEVLTGEERATSDLSEHYGPGGLDKNIELPERVDLMCADLFQRLAAAGDPKQKTLIFCNSDSHAERVAIALNNQYAKWAKFEGGDYAFKCTYTGGRDRLPDLRSSQSRSFIATTVDLISTGVDVPCLQNLVFFRPVRSRIPFHQMLGRGTRIDQRTKKLHFTVYDYMDATSLLDASLVDIAMPNRYEKRTSQGEPQVIYEVSDIQVHLEEGDIWIASRNADGGISRVLFEEYKSSISETIRSEVDDIKDFRNRWIDIDKRASLVAQLPDGESSIDVLRHGLAMIPYDGFDVIGEVCFGQTARTKAERADRLAATRDLWGGDLPKETTDVLVAYGAQFAHAGTTGFEEPRAFDLPPVREAGGFEQLGADVAELVDRVKLQVFVLDSEWRAA